MLKLGEGVEDHWKGRSFGKACICSCMESSRLVSGAFTRNGHQFVLAETCPSLGCEDVSGTECPMVQVIVSPGSAFGRKKAQKSSTGNFLHSMWLSLSGTLRVGVNVILDGHFWQGGKCGAAVTTGNQAQR